MTGFRDEEAKAKCQAECNKRNKHVLKTHPMRWKPLWDAQRGWQPAFRPGTAEVERKGVKS